MSSVNDGRREEAITTALREIGCAVKEKKVSFRGVSIGCIVDGKYCEYIDGQYTQLPADLSVRIRRQLVNIGCL